MDINTLTELGDFPKSYKIFDISYFSDRANAIKRIMLEYFWTSMLRLILLYLFNKRSLRPKNVIRYARK